MKRISRGPVKGISLLLQEEERERRDNYVPDASILETMMDHFEIDEQTKVFIYFFVLSFFCLFIFYYLIDAFTIISFVRYLLLLGHVRINESCRHL